MRFVLQIRSHAQKFFQKLEKSKDEEGGGALAGSLSCSSGLDSRQLVGLQWVGRV